MVKIYFKSIASNYINPRLHGINEMTVKICMFYAIHELSQNLFN